MPPLEPMDDKATKPLRPAGFINRKIMESAGDLGVPRVVKREATKVKPFNLSSRPASARGERPSTAKTEDEPKVLPTPRTAGDPSKALEAAKAKRDALRSQMRK